jgi:hypothetical protein
MLAGLHEQHSAGQRWDKPELAGVEVSRRVRRGWASLRGGARRGRGGAGGPDGERDERGESAPAGPAMAAGALRGSEEGLQPVRVSGEEREGRTEVAELEAGTAYFTTVSVGLGPSGTRTP